MPREQEQLSESIDRSWDDVQESDVYKKAGRAIDPGGIFSDPIRNEFEASAYDPNAAAFRMENAAQWRGQLAAGAAGAADRAAAQVGPVAGYGGAQIVTGSQDQTRNYQMTLADQLMARASGQGGPSPAELQMQRGMESAIAAQRSQAAGAGGSNRSAAMRGAAANIGQIQQGTIADTATLRAQEQIAAQQQAGGLLSQARGQDIGLAQAQAQLGQQAGLFTAGAQNQATLQQGQMDAAQMAQNDAMVQYYLDQGMGIDEANLNAAIALEQMRSDQAVAAMNANAAVSAQNAQMAAQQQGGILSAAGAGIGGLLSDETAKENIDRKYKPEVYEFLDLLDGASYDYKNKDHGEGKHYGVMAQSAEKSRLGSSLVKNIGGLKALDIKKTLGALLLSVKDSHERLKILEPQGA